LAESAGRKKSRKWGSEQTERKWSFFCFFLLLFFYLFFYEIFIIIFIFHPKRKNKDEFSSPLPYWQKASLEWTLRRINKQEGQHS